MGCRRNGLRKQVTEAKEGAPRAQEREVKVIHLGDGQGAGGRQGEGELLSRILIQGRGALAGRQEYSGPIEN